MNLLLKFNLAFLLVFTLGWSASAWVARGMLQSDARQEALEQARLLIEKADAISAYTAHEVTPLLESQMAQTFLPQAIPAYSSAAVLSAFRSTYPDYSHRHAMLNPTNPRDRVLDWEADLVSYFKRTPSSSELVGQRDTPSGPSLYVARPIRIADAACMRCHGATASAPVPMVAKYGPVNGFGWKMNETLGVQVVTVPMAVPMQRADHALKVILALLAGAFVLMGVTLDLMLLRLVIRPVIRLSHLSDRVSLGELDAPDFEAATRDEIGVLSKSLSRMRISLAHAMTLLDGR